MAVVVINPNSTVSMTEAMCAAAQGAVPDMQFEGWTSHQAPAAIQGEADGKAAEPHLLALVAQASADGADGIIIGCFDDTALVQAAAVAACPVVGIGQASYAYAVLRQWRFSVVTTLSVSVPILENNIAAQGALPHLGRVRASEVPVLALEADEQAASARIVAEARAAVAEDNINAIVLGCAGMVHVVSEVRSAVDVAVIDPVVCAAQSMRWLLS